jgi:hypothetical protein
MFTWLEGREMAEVVSYFAIVDFDESVDSPSGLVRRTEDEEGFTDESPRRDFSWGHSSAIVSWERGEGVPLVEISSDEAERIIERFRREWGNP